MLDAGPPTATAVCGRVPSGAVCGAIASGVVYGYGCIKPRGVDDRALELRLAIRRGRVGVFYRLTHNTAMPPASDPIVGAATADRVYHASPAAGVEAYRPRRPAVLHGSDCSARTVTIGYVCRNANVTRLTARDGIYTVT